MSVIDYTKCMHCSRIEKLAHSTTSDTKLYTDCWLCDEAGSFVVSDYITQQKIQ
jgi:hypothetical protein